MKTRRRITFDTIREIGKQLRETEVGTAYGSPALKVNGRVYAGINKEAEPNSLAVYLADFEQREALLAEDPDTYYVKSHYEPYPIVLVRLSCVRSRFSSGSRLSLERRIAHSTQCCEA